MKLARLLELESRLAIEEPEFRAAPSELDKFSCVRGSDVANADVQELISFVRLWVDDNQFDARVCEFKSESLYDLPVHACRAVNFRALYQLTLEIGGPGDKLTELTSHGFQRL